ncbi:hypothetical protein [Streptomyces sp. NPDC058086]|uniref:hypothetical protein n=1 Tax=Streptomyces sp. NPDC058086 TaxID=3346334 RepID=UPI0036EAE5F6
MTALDGRTADQRPGRAGACVRAGMFALVGSVLAAFGHHAVVEGPVPWPLVTAFTAAQFAAVWPLARRRSTLPATVVCTLAAQGALHAAFTLTGSAHHARSAHAARAASGWHHSMAVGDGHAWHDAGSAMTIVHVVAALAVAWLLHRADMAMAAALATVRMVHRATQAFVRWVLPTVTTVLDSLLLRQLATGRPVGFFELPALEGTQVLRYAVVRRGPPRDQ